MFFIKYSKNRENLNRILKDNEKRFREMERRAANVIEAITHTRLKYDESEEVVDMCQTIQEMRIEERKIGELKKAQEIARNFYNLGVEVEKIAQGVGYAVETVKEWLGEDNDALLLWAKFIASERKEDFDVLATKNPYIESAYKQLQVISQDEQKRLEYEAREKAIRDYNQMMFEARESGREEGREEGIKEGIKNEKYNTAKNLIALGLPTDIIAQGTGLSVDEIEKIRTL